MSDTTTAAERDGVPEDYPGRIVDFPPGVEHLVIVLIGVQGADDAHHDAFMNRLVALTAEESGPQRIERMRTTDGAGVATTMVEAYWTSSATWRAWWESAPVAGFWRQLPLAGETGYFLECMTIPAARFNYAAGVEDRHGAAAVLPLKPCATFGYWGAYRDRLPASADDDFASPLAQPPTAQERDTRARRLTVRVPDNLCYIREGQGWEHCGEQERAIWEAQMDGVVDEWVARLGADPAATGCLSIRDCREQAAAGGAPIERRSQLAFLLSLGHIEQAARTDPAHLAVHGAFVKMYREPQFTPRMHVWVELGVLKQDELVTEYVNCHPRTGLLPYFDAVPVDA